MFRARAGRRILTVAAAAGLIALGGLTSSTAANAAPTPEIVITTPVDGAQAPSTLFELAGTAPIGASLTYEILDGSAEVSEPVIADGDGFWSFEVHLARSENGPVDIAVNGVTTDNLPLPTTAVTITPLPLLAAPVIVTPADGSTLSDPHVLVTGTAVPNTSVILQVLEADRPNDVVILQVTAVSGDDGSWSAELDLVAGPFVVFAYALDAQGGFASGNDLAEFVIVAAAVPAIPVPAATPRAELAATGAAPTTQAIVAALLLALGAAALIAGRRRETVLAAD